MRIIKNGIKDEIKVNFVCKNCHCEFECNEEEFWMEQQASTLTYPLQHACFSNCPQCHRICKTYKTKNDINISVTSDVSNKDPLKFCDFINKDNFL